VAIVELRGATVSYGDRCVLDALDLDIAPAEFLAVLGPNGAGKTTMLKVLLGLVPLAAGEVTVAGRPPRKASRAIGYIPQQAGFDRDLPIRGRDLVRFGVDGHRPGLPLTSRRTRDLVTRAIDSVGASAYASGPIGKLSGGEQQRLRIAQALVTDPDLLLCDEPLLSLDLAHQQGVSALINERREQADTAVVFVTHEINPILPYVDRVLYLVDGRWAVGTPDEVLTSARLSALYDTPVDVLRVRDRILVVGSDEPHHHHA
jgi:zinc/manganese transport system ATP-binding protein